MRYHGRYFEEFHEGQEFSLPPFSISQYQMEEFGRLTGDLNPLHTDAEFCRAEGLFGRPVVHGMATLSFAMGVIDTADIFRGTCLAFADVHDLHFLKPVYPGYALWAKLTVQEVIDLKDKPFGIVNFHLVVEDARERVLEATVGILVKRRAAALKMGIVPLVAQPRARRMTPRPSGGLLRAGTGEPGP